MSYDLDQFLDTPLFDVAAEKAAFLAHMEDLKRMGVEESTFWKKWVEVQDYREFGSKPAEVKSKIWRPTNINDLNGTIAEIRALQPRIFYVDPTPPQREINGVMVDDLEAIRRAKVWMDDWLMLRVFCHTMAYDQTPGRFLRFLVVDDVSGQYLGATSLSNDVMALTCRDNFIGWTSDNRCKDGMLIHSAIGSCIMGTQPFG